MDNFCFYCQCREAKLREKSSEAAYFNNREREDKNIIDKIELNKCYKNYGELCDALGWKKNTGNAKKAQIDALEKAFEIIRPINPKTGKPTQGFIFTKQKAELIEPSRKNNGKTRIISDEDFNAIWYYVVKHNFNVLNYHNQLMFKTYEGDVLDVYVYITNSKIYEGFGIPVDELYAYISRKSYVMNIFRSIFFNCISALITRRLKARYTENLPFEKGILRYYGQKTKSYVIDDTLLSEFNKFEREGFNEYGVNNVFEAQAQGVYSTILTDIKEKFKKKKKYGVSRTNKICIPKSEVKLIKYEYELSIKELKQYQFKFCVTLVSQIWKSIQERITNEEKYKDFCLTGRQQHELGCIYMSVKKMLLKPYVSEYPDDFFAFQVKPFSFSYEECCTELDENEDWLDICLKYDTFPIEQTREYMLEHLKVS